MSTNVFHVGDCDQHGSIWCLVTEVECFQEDNGALKWREQHMPVPHHLTELFPR